MLDCRQLVLRGLDELVRISMDFIPLVSSLSSLTHTHQTSYCNWYIDNRSVKSLLFFGFGSLLGVPLVNQILSYKLYGVLWSVLYKTYLTLATSVIAWSKRGTTVLSRYCLTGIVFRSLFCIKPAIPRSFPRSNIITSPQCNTSFQIKEKWLVYVWSMTRLEEAEGR